MNNQLIINRLKNNPEQFKIVRGVPVFDAHEEINRDPNTGQQVVERFSKADLEEICRNCNRYVAAGFPVGLSEGHTLDHAPESSQPRTLGWAMNYRVEWSPEMQRDVILHDEYYEPQIYAYVKDGGFAYRSVERWRTEKRFSPVALLRRHPRRPLPPVQYKRGDYVIRYSMEAFKMSQQAPERIFAGSWWQDTRVRYSAADQAPPGQWVDPAGNVGQGRPPGAPEPQQVSPERYLQSEIERCVREYPRVDKREIYAAAQQVQQGLQPDIETAMENAASVRQLDDERFGIRREEL